MSVVKVEKNSYTVEPLYQWDLNQVLEIHGLSMAVTPEIHFTNDAMVRALRRFATMDAAGVVRAEVPNALLQKPYKIKAMVCIREGEIFKTYRELAIPVKARNKPADYTITDEDDIYSFQALENLVNDSVVKMAQDSAAAAAAAAQAVNTANAAANTANGVAATANDAKTAAENAATAAGDAKNAADNAATAAGQAKTTADAALPKAGGTMTGAVKMKGIFLTEGEDFGDDWPAEGLADCRLYFIAADSEAAAELGV